MNNYDLVFHANGSVVADCTAEGETSLHALENNIQNFDLPKNILITVLVTNPNSGLTVEYRLSKSSRA